MLRRAAALGAGLTTLIVVALLMARLVHPDIFYQAPIFLSEHAVPIFILEGIILLQLAATGFLLWKIDIQPRLSGFVFNHTQNPEVVRRNLGGVPKFYDTNTPGLASSVATVEKNAPMILAEIRTVLAEHKGVIGDGFRIAYNNKVMALSSSWRTLNIISYGVTNSALFPKTLEILKSVPNLFICNLSRMGPRSQLKFHAGESSCYIRCHLGVKIPAEAPISALYVDDEMRSWEEGRVQAFCDAHWHGAVNSSDQTRYVLIFDIMPANLGWYTKQFCALMLAFSVTQYLLPGRLSSNEPLWHPSVLIGYICLVTVGIPLAVGLYFYFRYFCRRRPTWLRRLADAGFGFYF
jgi:hypothetical protein